MSERDGGGVWFAVGVGPFEGGGKMPDVVRVHPGRIFLHGHQEDVLLLVGRVEGQDAHHDEVRDEEEFRRTGGTNNHQIFYSSI